MSVVFTPVEDWANQTQDLIGFNELVLAYSERRQVLGQSAIAPLTAGVNGFDKTLCLAMQEWCEANCTSFIDHVSGPLNGGSTAFLYFTLATWREAAGLHADGFRRRVEPDDVDSYGTIEVGDTRGDWCFEDLQKGFNALIWTIKAGILNSIQRKYGYSFAEYAAASWIDDSFEGPTLYRTRYKTVPVGGYYLSRVRGKSILSDIPILVPHTAHIYLVPQSDIFLSWYNYYDLDAYGMTEDELWLFQNFAVSSSSSHTTDFLGNIETEPASSPTGADSINCLIGGWLLKWNFTNSG